MSAEIVVQSLDAQQARSLTDRIRGSLATAHDGLIEAYQGRAWEALDYDSWDSYCGSEFSGARMVRLEQAQQREMVVSMRAAGMSGRAIGSGLGVSEGTVRNVLAGAQDYAPAPVTGLDGKTYQPTDPGRGARLIHSTGEIVDAEVVDAEVIDAPSVMAPTLGDRERQDAQARREAIAQVSARLGTAFEWLGAYTRYPDLARRDIGNFDYRDSCWRRPVEVADLRLAAAGMTLLADLFEGMQ